MEKNLVNASEFAKFDKNVLIKLLSTLETEVRDELDRFKTLPEPFFTKTKKLFKSEKDKLNPMKNESIISSILSYTLKQVKLHPVTFKIVFENEPDYELDIDEEDGENEEELDKYEYLQWDDVVCENINQVIMINTDGFNDDRRSCHSDGFQDSELICHLKLKESVSEKRAPNKLTLRDLTEMLYRVKGSKYDFWYELFSNIKTHIDENVQASCDHGS